MCPDDPWNTFPVSGRLASTADARDLGLDRTEEGLVNVVILHAGEPAPPRRTRPSETGNHRIAARGGNQLRHWRPGGAANMPRTMTLPPTTTGPEQIRAPVRQKAGPRAPLTRRRESGEPHGSSWTAKASGANSASEMGGRAYNAGDQLPKCLCAPGEQWSVLASIPIASSTRSVSAVVLALAVE